TFITARTHHEPCTLTAYALNVFTRKRVQEQLIIGSYLRLLRGAASCCSTQCRLENDAYYPCVIIFELDGFDNYCCLHCYFAKHIAFHSKWIINTAHIKLYTLTHMYVVTTQRKLFIFRNHLFMYQWSNALQVASRQFPLIHRITSNAMARNFTFIRLPPMTCTC
ncbi:uncharacterized protein LOC118751929, partial [Rhagoletis pomonella]|uniref:uncharacterized protein LOC118751928 n=1 Tax=Rhagoletis pomonella TaxID=28610 RepID=UPI00178219C5